VGFTTKLGLRIGLEIDEIALRKLIAADEVIKARDHALRLLLIQTYTREQMIEALEKSGFCDDAVNETIENLEQLGHIKDEKYAKNWVRNRRRTRPTSKMAMRRELTSQGVDKSTAERVLAEIDDADEAALALQLARKQANRYKSLAPHVVKRRLHAFLLRRGFDHETIGQVMRQVLTMEQSRQR
jgi:regulatory protein